MTKDQEDTILSALAEAEREIREMPTEKVDVDYVRQRLEEALAQLPRKDES